MQKTSNFQLGHVAYIYKWAVSYHLCSSLYILLLSCFIFLFYLFPQVIPHWNLMFPPTFSSPYVQKDLVHAFPTLFSIYQVTFPWVSILFSLRLHMPLTLGHTVCRNKISNSNSNTEQTELAHLPWQFFLHHKWPPKPCFASLPTPTWWKVWGSSERGQSYLSHCEPKALPLSQLAFKLHTSGLGSSICL